MKKEQIKKMIEIALSQLAYSYTPYSDFKVGAAWKEWTDIYGMQY